MADEKEKKDKEEKEECSHKWGSKGYCEKCGEDKLRAKRSLKEEKKAVKDYSEREEDSKSPKLKKDFKHAIGEEKQHAKMFAKEAKK